MKHYNIKVTGKVQGVFFRAATQEKAQALGIYGMVRNEPDGSVFIEAEGQDEALKRFIQWCRIGPSHARVDHMELEESELKNYSSFKISLHH